jgi:DNA-binding transcriptional LysR family regulator
MGMSIDLRLMRYVVSVADEGGFQRAAERLRIAQPPLSRQVRELEKWLGVTLFERRPTRPTEAGRVFVEEARRILADVERAVELARAAGQGITGTVRVGYGPTSAYEEVPRLVAVMGERYPGIQVEPHEAWDGELADGLRQGRLDVLLGRYLPRPSGCEAQDVRREPYAVVLSAAHPLADEDEIALRDLRGEVFRFFPRRYGPVYYDAVIASLASTGETFDIWENPTPGMRNLGLRDTGEGFTLLPRSVGELLGPDVRCLPLSDRLPEIALEALWMPNPAPAVATFLRTADALARAEGWLPQA